MFKIKLTIICLVLTLSTFAQTEQSMPNYYPVGDSIQNKRNDHAFPESQKKKVDFGLEMGTSIGAMNGQSLFSTYISPYARYPLSDRFSLEVGTTIARGNSLIGYHPYYGETIMPMSSNLLQTSLYASGRYEVNTKLTVFGTGSVQKNIFLSPGEGEENISFDTHAMSIGLEYKLGRNAKLYFEFQTRRMQYPGLLTSPSMFDSGSLNPVRQ